MTSAPAVHEASELWQLWVQTQWDLLVVHITVLTSEMAEVAIYHQVIIRRILREDVHSLDPYLHSFEGGGGGGEGVK